jgi:peptidyl-prolyl cis-trans isomerase D
VIYEASQIIPSATAPLAEIREQVTADWRKAQGNAAAKQAADRAAANDNRESKRSNNAHARLHWRFLGL